MPNHTFQTIIVTGVGDATAPEDGDVASARAKALDLFDPDLVTPLSDVGYNFIQSFAILPTGSGNERDPQMAHHKAVEEFTTWLKAETPGLDYVAVRWNDSDEPSITHSHEGRYQPA